MPTAGVIATQLTDRSARPKTLTIGGLDVLGLNGSSYKVQRESIHVHEAGPGAVSSLEFTIWDPSRVLTVAEGQWVEFWDHACDVPLFAGPVQTWVYMPAGPSRYVTLRCAGIEAVLDWMILTGTLDVQSPEDGAISEWVVAAAGQAAGVGIPLHCNINESLYTTDRDNAISDLSQSASSNLSAFDAGGQTLREVIAQAFALWRPFFDYLTLGIDYNQDVLTTVDFYGNLRVYPVDFVPDHYATLTITDTAAGAVATTVLEHRTDATSVPHAVYVTGANAAGTGLVGDGTGLPGPIATLSDTTSDTAARRQSIGLAYLVGLASSIRGTLTIEKYTNPSTPTSQVRAGSPITITDATVGLSSYQSVIASIDKTFNSDGSENWTIAYGGHPPSVIRQIRHHGRAQRS
jgi:hypothetical protein